MRRSKRPTWGSSRIVWLRSGESWVRRVQVALTHEDGDALLPCR